MNAILNTYSYTVVRDSLYKLTNSVVVLEKGEVLYQVLDQPTMFSNGLVVVSIDYIKENINKDFKLNRTLSFNLRLKCINLKVLNERDRTSFIKMFKEISRRPYGLIFNNGVPSIISIKGELPRKKKKQFRKLLQD